MNTKLLNSLREFSIYGPYRAKSLKDLISVYYDFSKPDAKAGTYRLILRNALDICSIYANDKESRWHKYCTDLYKDVREEAINLFIEEHLDAYFDELEEFRYDVDYQNAQRDIGEIEYIYSNDPESIIYEKKYDYLDKHFDIIKNYLFVNGGDK